MPNRLRWRQVFGVSPDFLWGGQARAEGLVGTVAVALTQPVGACSFACDEANGETLQKATIGLRPAQTRSPDTSLRQAYSRRNGRC